MNNKRRLWWWVFGMLVYAVVVVLLIPVIAFRGETHWIVWMIVVVVLSGLAVLAGLKAKQ